jgi:glucosyl-dolichyl phosphate glucuronosyltransferase
VRRPLTVAVVICAYTERRWDQLLAAIDSASAQPETDRVILVVDHNDVLLQRARHARPGITAVANAGKQGLSGARNTGIEVAHEDLIAFLDDDAEAHEGWLRHLVAPFSDPTVQSVGGKAVPLWPGDVPSPVLPAELLWIVGCTFKGQPETLSEVRNVMGCSMVFRRETLLELGGFDTDTGRVGRIPLGGEETDLCIRLAQMYPDSRVLFEPRSVVSHNVSDDRVDWSYLRRRSFYEGVSKSVLSRKLGDQALSSESAYTRSVLPRGIVRELSTFRLDGVRKAAAIVVSLFSAGAGYVYGSANRKSAVPDVDEAPVVLDRAA